jgi:uncharacterized protein YneF (UPF0154 family)
VVRVLILIVVLCVAGAMLIGTFARLLALRRQWRDQPPPRYSRPYQRWDDEDRRGR